MTTMTSFREIVPVISARVNGATKDYTFYIKPIISISAGSSITIQIIDTTNGTNEITFLSSISCRLSYSSNTIPANCTVSGSTAMIVPGLALSDTTGVTQYILVVSSMILARTPTTSSDLKITSFTPLGFGVQTTTVTPDINN